MKEGFCNKHQPRAAAALKKSCPMKTVTETKGIGDTKTIAKAKTIAEAKKEEKLRIKITGPGRGAGGPAGHGPGFSLGETEPSLVAKKSASLSLSKNATNGEAALTARGKGSSNSSGCSSSSTVTNIRSEVSRSSAEKSRLLQKESCTMRRDVLKSDPVRSGKNTGNANGSKGGSNRGQLLTFVQSTNTTRSKNVPSKTNRSRLAPPTDTEDVPGVSAASPALRQANGPLVLQSNQKQLLQSPNNNKAVASAPRLLIHTDTGTASNPTTGAVTAAKATAKSVPRVKGTQTSPHNSLAATCARKRNISTTAEPAERCKEEQQFLSSMDRQISKGYTNETWYDFDWPLDRSDPITIIHFNDVYNIQTRPDGSGGVARFVTALQQYQHLHPLILFSGDALNPSLMSTYTRGKHMIPFLNVLKIHTACFGNHDFDFGIDDLEYAVGSCNFPWLISNVFQRMPADVDEQKQLQQAQVQQPQRGRTKTGHLFNYSKLCTMDSRECCRNYTRVFSCSSSSRLSPDTFSTARAQIPPRKTTTNTPHTATKAAAKAAVPIMTTAAEADATTIAGAKTGTTTTAAVEANTTAAAETAAATAGIGEVASTTATKAAEKIPTTTTPRPAETGTATTAKIATSTTTASAAGDGAEAPSQTHAQRQKEQRQVQKEVPGGELSESDDELMSYAEGPSQAHLSLAETEEEGSGRFAEDYIEVHGLPLANGLKYRLCEWQGFKVGLIGLVEGEWLDTLACIDREDVCYVDFVKAANCLSRVLRQKECELVIAMTHMRAPNDEKLAREAEDIDLILGGHDHDYYGLQRIGNVPVVKSGTDFEDFTVLTIYPGRKKQDNPCPLERSAGTTGEQQPAADTKAAVADSELADAAVDKTALVVDAAIADAAIANAAVPDKQAADIVVVETAEKLKEKGAVSDAEDCGSLSHAHFSATDDEDIQHRQLLKAVGLQELKRRDSAHPPPLGQYNGPLLPSDCEGGESELPFFLEGSLLKWERVHVCVDKFAINKHVESMVRKYQQKIEGQMNEILVEAACPLEARFSVVRSTESNVGNWLCDTIRRECRADIAILNSGTMRADCLFPAGPFRLGDLARLLPMADSLCVISVKGSQLLEALENSVSQLPRTEGRFLQVSGIRFLFDSSKPGKQRILPNSVKVMLNPYANITHTKTTSAAVFSSCTRQISSRRNTQRETVTDSSSSSQGYSCRSCRGSSNGRTECQTSPCDDVNIRSTALAAPFSSLHTDTSSHNTKSNSSCRSCCRDGVEMDATSEEEAVVAEQQQQNRQMHCSCCTPGNNPLSVAAVCGGGDGAARLAGGVEEVIQKGNDSCFFEDLNLDKEYVVATKAYVAQGRDGYHMLSKCEVLVEEELLPPLPTMVRSALSMAELANGLKRPHSRIMFRRLTSFTSMQQDDLLNEFGCKVTSSHHYVLAPKVDGRIADVAAKARQ